MGGEEGQGRAPVLALFRWHTCGGVVHRGIKPYVFAVDQERVLFRLLIIPAHFAWTQEVGVACLYARDLAIFKIALKEGGLEGLRRAVMGFELPQEWIVSGFGHNKRYTCQEKGEPDSHPNSLAAVRTRAEDYRYWQAPWSYSG